MSGCLKCYRKLTGSTVVIWTLITWINAEIWKEARECVKSELVTQPSYCGNNIMDLKITMRGDFFSSEVSYRGCADKKYGFVCWITAFKQLSNANGTDVELCYSAMVAQVAILISSSVAICTFREDKDLMLRGKLLGGLCLSVCLSLPSTHIPPMHTATHHFPNIDCYWLYFVTFNVPRSVDISESQQALSIKPIQRSISISLVNANSIGKMQGIHSGERHTAKLA